MFFSRSFIVSGLAFKSLSHFEFISVYVRECSDFPLLYAAVQFSQYLVLKRMSFFMVQTCLLFHRSVDHRCVDSTALCHRASCPVPLVHISVFVPVSYCFDD